jgi:hypothetical protein
VGGGLREQHERLAEGVELELAVDPVADDVGSAWVARELESPLIRNGVAVDGVGGDEAVAVGEQPLRDEAHGVIEKRQRTGPGDRLTGEALVSDPHVPVVVVATLAGALGQRHGGGGHHAPARAGEP